MFGLARRTAWLSAVGLVALGCGPGANPHSSQDDAGAPAGDAAPAPDAPAGSVAAALMYAHSRDTLYTIDPDTLTLSRVGTFENGDDITDLAVTPDGTIYAISKTKLYRVDPVTGRATALADVPGLTNVGMTFLPDGRLLATDKAGGVRTIDPASGAVTEVGSFGGGYATAGDLVAVADGTMFAISDEGPVGDEFTNNWLLRVDTTTGAASPVGQIGYGRVFGAAFSNGRVYAFTEAGLLVEINPQTGAGTSVRDYPVEFWGAGVTPLVRIE